MVTAVKVVVGDKQLHLKQTVDATLTCLEKENTVQHVLVMKTGDTAYEPLPRDIDLEMVCVVLIVCVSGLYSAC